MENSSGFDFHLFKPALEAKDADAWSSFYAENSEWLECGAAKRGSRPLGRYRNAKG